ncbi:helix-turn-helix domain-containing protein [Maribacter sp. 2210JD10-5]|uniref:helix-turn-helix domain-containing protein n=1 Tax=Maribacter sp. 2210JD10-5 TaxID=3386272 RepID=UPI0039BCDD67
MDFNIISLLDTAGFVQGLVLGILLIVLNKRKHRTTTFLGLFLILYACQRVPVILRDLKVYDNYPELYMLPLNFFWLLMPLFYLYTQEISVFSSNKKKYWLLFPGIIAFIIQVIVFFLPYETKLYIAPNLWRGAFFVSGAVYSWIVGFWNLKLLSDHRNEVRNHFSMLVSRELQWARTFLFFSLTGTILYMAQAHFLSENQFSRFFFLAFDLIVIYWVSYHGVVQRNILSLAAKKQMYDSVASKKSQEVIPLPSLSKEYLQELVEKIDGYMNTSESFVHTELTIIDLAEKVDVHPKRISKAINTIRNQNFNSYVNLFRIKKAEQILKNNEEEHLSIEGIGNEVGFHSKSAFYSAFRKVTGTTPTKYKQYISA